MGLFLKKTQNFARMSLMKTFYDVQQFLKRFGIIVYMGKRLYDIELMKLELSRIYDAGLMDKIRLSRSRSGSSQRAQGGIEDILRKMEK